MNKQETIDKVNGMQPSLVLFTQEQVIELVNSLECAKNENTISREKLQEILIQYGRTILDAIKNEMSFEDCVDYNSARFEMINGCEIGLESVDVNNYSIYDTIENNLFLDEIAGELVEEHFPMSEIMELTISENN